MTKTKKLFGIALMSLIIFLSIVRVPVSAVKVNITRQELKYFEGIATKEVVKYPAVKLYLGGKYISESAYLINETTYVPLRAVTTLAGATIKYDPILRRAEVAMPGLQMTVTDGSYIVFANGRPLLSKTPAVILSDGRMYLPVRSLAKALSLGVEWRSDRSVLLTGDIKPLASADDYYRKDDVYWLSRIISAESRGEPLLGQIAVGNVVLNRVRHKDYPSTIYGVIFDKKYGVQFSPVKDGSIYSEPTYSATVAAKICLEGISVSPDILFFLEPSKSTSSWIPQNRKYAFTVENHYFFY